MLNVILIVIVLKELHVIVMFQHLLAAQFSTLRTTRLLLIKNLSLAS